MISLYNTLKESLLGGFDEIEASADPKEEIRRFVKDNYTIHGHIKISDKPNENGKYVVDCSFSVYVKHQKYISLTKLTNGMFEWGEVKGDFDCSNCSSLTSLEGAPKEVGGNFHCYNCDSLRFESINDLSYRHKIFGDSSFLRGINKYPYDIF